MKRNIIFLAIFCLLSSLVWADGGADRKITVEEKAFMQDTHRKIIDLLPAPVNGVEKKPGDPGIPNFLGVGAEKFPLYFSFYCDYQKTVDMDKMLDVANDSKGMEEMSQQMSKISEEMEAAINSGDSNKVMELQAKLQAVMSGNASMKKMTGAIDDQKKQSFQVNVSVNPNGADYFLYKEIPAPANVSIAIRREKNENPPHKFTNTDTVLFFGSFGKKKVNDTYEIYAPRVEAKSTRIHRLIISFQGEAALVDEYIGKMNLAEIAALTR